MILIADSGSTKTYWSLLNDEHSYSHYYTPGINPFFQTEYEIEGHFRMNLLPKLGISEIPEIYFYGAGCATEKQKGVVRNAFAKVFNVGHVEVESDLLGAARALCGNKPGIACILGTGSNSCYYDGKEIVKQVSPLGYIIGDEGSGAVLGKRLVADCLKNQLSEPIRERFFDRFKLTQAQIVENIYSKPFPNRFLASLSVFLKENIDEPEIFDIVYEGFSDFFKRNVFQYNYLDIRVNVVGSVGYHYQSVLRQVADDLSVELGKIIQAPTDELIAYHISRNSKLEVATHGI
jgi:N-acetylglucosamine kinase-like BadF-type ATPase